MFRMSKNEFGLLFWVHLFLIITAYLSFLYVDWKIIFWSVVVLQFYYSLRGGCDLTFAEFGEDKDIVFVWYYLKKVFPNLDKKTTKNFIRYVMPIFLVSISFFLQKIMNFTPLIKL
jgi:hypothetical protein